MEIRAKNNHFAQVGKKLIEEMKELSYIKNSEARIIFLQSDYDKKHNGQLVFGLCERVQSKNQWAIEGDFTITIYTSNTRGFSEEQIKILLFHELLHVGIDVNNEGKEIYSVLPHDLEDFKLIISKYGVDWAKVE